VASTETPPTPSVEHWWACAEEATHDDKLADSISTWRPISIACKAPLIKSIPFATILAYHENCAHVYFTCYDHHMAQVEEFLDQLELSQYLNEFLCGGFTTLDSLRHISESDFARLNVRLGHRRKIKRAIARQLSWPDLSPLPRYMRYDQVLPRGRAFQGQSSSDLLPRPALTPGLSSGMRIPGLVRRIPVTQRSSTCTSTNARSASDLRAHVSTTLRDKVILLDTYSDQVIT